jgi:hypothetical protein
MAPLCSLRGERNGSHSGERLREPGEHHEVGVKAYALQATDTERASPLGALFCSEPIRRARPVLSFVLSSADETSRKSCYSHLLRLPPGAPGFLAGELGFSL